MSQGQKVGREVKATVVDDIVPFVEQLIENAGAAAVEPSWVVIGGERRFYEDDEGVVHEVIVGVVVVRKDRALW